MADIKSILNQLFGTSESGEAVLSSPLKGMSDNLVSKTRGDKFIWSIVIILTLASLLLVYSSTGSLAYRMSKSTESYLFKQFAFYHPGVDHYLFCSQDQLCCLLTGSVSVVFNFNTPVIIYIIIWCAVECRKPVDKTTSDQHDFPDIRSCKTCFIHVHEQAVEPQTKCDQGF